MKHKAVPFVLAFTLALSLTSCKYINSDAISQDADFFEDNMWEIAKSNFEVSDKAIGDIDILLDKYDLTNVESETKPDVVSKSISEEPIGSVTEAKAPVVEAPVAAEPVEIASSTDTEAEGGDTYSLAEGITVGEMKVINSADDVKYVLDKGLLTDEVMGISTGTYVTRLDGKRGTTVLVQSDDEVSVYTKDIELSMVTPYSSTSYGAGSYATTYVIDSAISTIYIRVKDNYLYIIKLSDEEEN